MCNSTETGRNFVTLLHVESRSSLVIRPKLLNSFFVLKNSPHGLRNLSPVLSESSHSLIGLSVLPGSLTSSCVCLCVFPCRLWAAVSAGSGEAVPVSADGEPELQHLGGRCRGSAKSQRWTVDCESYRAGDGTTCRHCLTVEISFFKFVWIYCIVQYKPCSNCLSRSKFKTEAQMNQTAARSHSKIYWLGTEKWKMLCQY